MPDFKDWVPTLAVTDWDPAKLLAVVEGGVATEQGTIGDFLTLASGLIVPAAVAATLADPALAPTVVADPAFDPGVEAAVLAYLAAGANITLTPVGATLEIAASGGGGGSGFPYVAGWWRWFRPSGNVGAGAAPGANGFRFWNFQAQDNFTLDQAGIRINAALAGNCEIGFHAVDLTTGRATGLPLGVTAAMSTAAGGLLPGVLTPNPSFVAGNWYAVGVVFDNAGVPQTHGGQNDPYLGWAMGAATQAGLTGSINGSITCYGYVGAFGTWPDLTAQAWTDFSSNTAPAAMGRVL